MAHRLRRGRAPPSLRRDLALSLAKASLSPGEVSAVPLIYAIEQLARRWGIPPWQLDTDDPDVSRWLQRGLLFSRFESEARPKKKG